MNAAKWKSDLYALGSLTGRNLKLFLKDKAGVFFSLLAPLIVFMLYFLFLGDVQMDSVKAFFPEGVPFDEKAVRGFIDSWMVAGVLGVACITVSIVANTVTIKDKTSGVMNDVLASPIGRWVPLAAHFLFNFIVTVFIVFFVTAVCFIYLGATGSWYLSAGETFAVLGTVVFSSLSATTVSVLICGFFQSENALSAFTGIVSAGVGFLIGAFMPMSMFPKAIQYVAGLLPGSHSAGIFRNLLMAGPLDNLAQVMPAEAVAALKEGYCMDFEFFGMTFDTGLMCAYVAGAIVLFLAIDVLLATRKNSIFLTISQKGLGKKRRKAEIKK